MRAGKHALAWLVVANAVGLYLALLLLAPGLQLGALSYGRWVPVHLNLQLYGWTALPLVAWLLDIYAVGRRSGQAVTVAWSAALAAGALAWLSGGSSGKIFLDWQGGALWAFLAVLAGFWIVLAISWWRGRHAWPPARRWLTLAGLVVLTGVPVALWLAAQPHVYPPIDPSTGGPTGASLLGSTLVVVALLLLLPRAGRAESGENGENGGDGMGVKNGNSFIPWSLIVYFTFCVGAWWVAETAGGSHFDGWQLGALALLLPWPWLVWRDWKRFAWPAGTGGWRAVLLGWWGLLVVSGFAVFLPGVLDRLKFTSGLVAHSHLAMAGFTSAFGVVLLHLRGERFGGRWGVWAWNLSVLVMVGVLALAGWQEGRETGWMLGSAWWRSAALVVRALCGLVMLAVALHWWLSWRPAAVDHDETHSLDVECGGGRDGCHHRDPVGVGAPAGPGVVGDHGAGGRARVAALDWRVCWLGRLGVWLGAQGRGGGGDDLGDHGAGAHGGGGLPHCDDHHRQAASRLGDGGRLGCLGGDGPGHRAAPRVVAGCCLTTPAGLGTAVRGALTVGLLYGFFLIFAQFAWVELLRAGGATHTFEKFALGTMAVAGAAAGFWVARAPRRASVIRWAMCVGAASAGCAALAPLAAVGPLALGVSLATGAALGVATVAVAASLRAWTSPLWAGLGTGFGYALCNLPWVFLAGPQAQALVAAGFAIAGAALVPGCARADHAVGGTEAGAVSGAGGDADGERHASPAWLVVVAFTALVWLDSAAFFIIQHQEGLREGTWGSAMLWRNAGVHLLTALVSGWWLRRGLRPVVVAAVVVLGLAGLAVNDASLRGLAGWIYPAGVSLYSVALIVWPGFFSPRHNWQSAARRAAWLFAVAGWFGSANGIGMAQTLHEVPVAFVVAAGGVVVVALGWRRVAWPAWLALAGVAAIAVALPSGAPTSAPPQAGGGGEPFVAAGGAAGENLDAQIALGARVYRAEGCIHCHSQYVRPQSRDELLWGPKASVAEVLAQRPVIIGNRRQGPDLSQVGARRSPAWLRLHFLNPRDFAPDSPMPSYAHLFDDARGNALVAYLCRNAGAARAARAATAAAWRPAEEGTTPPARTGAELFARHCATCHGPGADGNGRLAGKLARPPANLHHGPFVWSPAGLELSERLARIVKFGLPGTDMPGHESLSDAEVNALVRWLVEQRAHDEAGSPPRREGR